MRPACLQARLQYVRRGFRDLSFSALPLNRAGAADFLLQHQDAVKQRLGSRRNDANIITLGSRLLTKKLAINCVNTFLNTKFEGGRHSKRIKKI